MCESKVYIQEKEEQKLVMEDTAKILFEGNKIKICGMHGNLKEIDNCKIDVINLMKHEIILKTKKADHSENKFCRIN